MTRFSQRQPSRLSYNLKRFFYRGPSPRASRLWGIRALREILCEGVCGCLFPPDPRLLEIRPRVSSADATSAQSCPVCWITDRDYLFITLISVHSMMKYAPSGCPLFILARDLTSSDRKALERIPGIAVMEPPSDRGRDVDKTSYVTSTALHKFDLPELFGSFDRLLYLDSDTLVCGGLDGLFRFDLRDALVAGVVDPLAVLRGHAAERLGTSAYINSGVLLMNLASMRAERVPERLWAAKLGETVSFYMDQDAINTVLDGRIRLLPPHYNWMPGNLARYRISLRRAAFLYGLTEADFPIDPAILHYANMVKPWHAAGDVPLRALWLAEAEETEAWLKSLNAAELLNGMGMTN